MKTYSDEAPVIFRSGGNIFVPVGIKIVQIDGPDGKKDYYEYNLYKIQDTGQAICKYDEFVRRNYSALRRIAYGPWETQMEKMYDGVWQQHVAKVKERFPSVDLVAVEL